MTYQDEHTFKLGYALTLFLEDLPQYIFLTEIIINFNTSIYQNGTIVKSRHKIMKQYIQKQFWYDFLIILPYFIVKMMEIQYLEVILLFRTGKIEYLMNTIYERINPNEKQQGIFELIKLSLMIFFVSHVTGCAFNLLGYQLQDKTNYFTWLDKQGQTDKSYWYEDYILALYWAVITMVTVGYGDIAPTNLIEYIFVIFITMVSCGIFAYGINQIGTIVGNMTTQSRDFKLRMAQLTKHMSKRDVSTDLQMKVKKYYEYFHTLQAEQIKECNMLLNSLAGSLKQDVMIEIFGKLLKNKKLFKLNFSKNFLEKLSLEMQEVQYGPDYVILNHNSDNSNIYFIRQGNIQLIRQNKSKNVITKSIKILTNGDTINEWSFISDQPPDIAAVTTDIVSLAYINKSDFLRVIKEFPSDNETYQMIKDNLNLYKFSRGLGIKCPICDTFNHITYQCPFVNYIPNHDKLMFQHQQQDQEQVRFQQQRKVQGTANALQDVKNIRNEVIKFIINNDDQNDDGQGQNYGQQQTDWLLQSTLANEQEYDIYDKINKIIEASTYNYQGDFIEDYNNMEFDTHSYVSQSSNYRHNKTKLSDLNDEYIPKSNMSNNLGNSYQIRNDRRNSTITVIRKILLRNNTKDMLQQKNPHESPKHTILKNQQINNQKINTTLNQQQPSFQLKNKSSFNHNDSEKSDFNSCKKIESQNYYFIEPSNKTIESREDEKSPDKSQEKIKNLIQTQQDVQNNQIKSSYNSNINISPRIKKIHKASSFRKLSVQPTKDQYNRNISSNKSTLISKKSLTQKQLSSIIQSSENEQESEISIQEQQIEEVLNVKGKNKKSDKVLLQFDKYQIWNVYLPHNNIDLVIKKYNLSQKIILNQQLNITKKTFQTKQQVLEYVENKKIETQKTYQQSKTRKSSMYKKSYSRQGTKRKSSETTNTKVQFQSNSHNQAKSLFDLNQIQK